MKHLSKVILDKDRDEECTHHSGEGWQAFGINNCFRV